jgi:5'-3' exonuclease
VNSIFYKAAHKCPADNEGALFKRVFEILDRAINKAYGMAAVHRDGGAVFLAVDGPAPWAKLLMQRKRRFATSKKNVRNEHRS